MDKIGSLKITTLAENLVQAGGLGQWGLSFLLELTDSRGEARKVVFDTGAVKEAFLHNVKLLEADLSDVDCIVISHGHGDHTAATVEVVEAAGGVQVYGHPNTFLPRFYVDREGRRRRGGPPEGEGLVDIEAAGGEVVLSEGPIEVVPGLWTTGQVERITEFDRISAPAAGARRPVTLDGRGRGRALRYYGLRPRRAGKHNAPGQEARGLRPHTRPGRRHPPSRAKRRVP
jgi:7,8-dihydropterin-6-yl-methyl-4-(beta-D-ribofuranosyl)aminobenzene 5'-phosphate synthase